MERLFVTGASGFVGSRLVEALARRRQPMTLLDRSDTLGRTIADATTEVVTGHLLAPEAYRAALGTAETVVHLAALTGRGSADDHVRANAEGTEVLLKACQRAGVRRMLFMSSIAVTFPDLTGYPYAQAKRHAEDAVRQAGIPFAILRPTMILGPGSPIQAALGALARLPIVPVFGNGRVRVQPVHVDDVVAAILAVLDEDLFGGETYEIGGPTTMSIDELLLAMRKGQTGRSGRTVHLPMRLVLPPLTAAARFGLERVMPISAGQMATFRFDGIAAPSARLDVARPALRGLSEMFATTSSADAVTGPAETSHPPSALLDRECRVFTRHLLGQSPTPYVRAKYAAAHAMLPALTGGGTFDDFLVRVASFHWLPAMLADSYARVFAPTSRLRVKLVMLLAILETCPPSYRAVDAALGGALPIVLLRLAIRGGVAALSLLAGTLVFGPARLALAVTGSRHR